MASVVKLNDVWAMLNNCAAGHLRKQSREYWIVTYNKKTYRSLPLGPHGHRHNPEIESGHVRSLVRQLGIPSGCVEIYLDLR